MPSPPAAFARASSETSLRPTGTGHAAAPWATGDRCGELRRLQSVGGYDGLLGKTGKRLVEAMHRPAKAEEIQLALRDGDLNGVSDALRRAAASCTKGDRAAVEEEIRHPREVLKTAMRCSRDCRDGLARDDFNVVKLAVRQAQHLELGPKMWEDPWLRRGRELLRARRSFDRATLLLREPGGLERLQAERSAECQRWVTERLERSAEFRPWLADSSSPGGCGALCAGPAARGYCESPSHFWFCLGCCCAQYSEERCLNGCDWRLTGWICLGSRCLGDACGCRRGQEFWRNRGSTRLLTPPPTPPRPPTPEEDLRLKEKSLKEVLRLVEKQGEYNWKRMVPPCGQIKDHLISLCKKERVSHEGTVMCMIQRINWMTMKRGEEDALEQPPLEEMDF